MEKHRKSGIACDRPSQSGDTRGNRRDAAVRRVAETTAQQSQHAHVK